MIDEKYIPAFLFLFLKMKITLICSLLKLKGHQASPLMHQALFHYHHSYSYQLYGNSFKDYVALGELALIQLQSEGINVSGKQS